jgi:hypothetical protein
VRKSPSAALCHSSLVVKRGKDTLLLILPHKELSGLVRSGLRGGDVNDARNVGQPRPKKRPGKSTFKASCTEIAKCTCASS